MSSPAGGSVLEVEPAGAAAVVRFRLPDLVTWETVQAVGRGLYDLVEREGRVRLVLDFGAVGHVHTDLLAKLLGAKRRAESAGGWLRLCGLNPRVRDLFALTRLDGLFPIYADAAEALRDV